MMTRDESTDDTTDDAVEGDLVCTSCGQTFDTTRAQQARDLRCPHDDGRLVPRATARRAGRPARGTPHVIKRPPRTETVPVTMPPTEPQLALHASGSGAILD